MTRKLSAQQVLTRQEHDLRVTGEFPYARGRALWPVLKWWGIQVIGIGFGLIGAALAPAAVVPPGFITTAAGTGSPGNSGDGGPGISASLSSVYGVDVDSAGNLYIADGDRVRKVDSNGIITTIAGPGNSEILGDGGPATSAYLSKATDIIADAFGSLYLATSAHRVRKIDPLGTITTVAGIGLEGFGGDGGPAIQARLSSPYRLALDSESNLFIADSGNMRARKVDKNGVITTVAGSGTVSWTCLAYGHSDQSLCGDGGLAIDAPLSVRGIGVDPAGNVYVSDSYHIRIRKISPDGTILSVAGNGGYAALNPPGICSGSTGPSTSVSITYPEGIEIDSLGQVYFADHSLLSCIRKLSGGTLSVVAGHSRNCPDWSGGDCLVAAPKDDGFPAATTTLQYARDVALSPTGDVYIAERGSLRVRKIEGLESMRLF